MVDFGEMDVYRQLAGGNILRAPFNKAHAEPVSDD
jgi:hypothetical protein